MSRETENFSMYSLMSIRTMLSSESNRYSARDRANCVFPTPVGPKNRKVPMGRFGSLRPARPRWMARTTLSMASSWPMIRACRRFFIRRMRLPSLSATLFTGMPVILDTTEAMASAVTVSAPPFLRARFSRTIDPASSRASMALSGRDLSVR